MTKDIFVLENSGSGRVMRITLQAAQGENYPATLSQLGIFADMAALQPNPGVVPYEPNLKFWSDGADKSRWFVIKNLTDTIGYAPEGNWSFPEGMGPGSSYAVGLGTWSGAAGIGYDSLEVSSLAITATEAAKFTVNVDASALTGFDNTPKSFVIASATEPVTGLASNNYAVVVSGGSFSGVWSLQTSGNNLLLIYSTGAPGFAGWALAQSLPEGEAGFEGDADHDR